MRYPHSLHSLLFLSFLSLILAKAAANNELSHRHLTNAQRLARGLPLIEPRDVRKPTKRYTAQLAKRSTSPEETESFVVAMQTASTDTVPVKRGPSGSWLCVNRGSITTIDDPSIASRFAWSETVNGMRTLQWISRLDIGDYVQGSQYPLEIVEEGDVFTPRFSVDQSVPSRPFSTELNAVLSPKYQTSYSDRPLDFLWIVDTDGKVHFAPDVATAVESYPGSSILIAQMNSHTSSGDISLALDNRDKGLTSQGKLYVLSSDGVGKWVNVGEDTMILTDSMSSGTSFYFPYLGATSLQKILWEQNEQSATVIRSDVTEVFSRFAVMSGSSIPAQFNIPTKGKGIVTPFVGASEWGFYTDSVKNALVTCSSQASCPTYNPICMELVPNGRKPFACAAAQTPAPGESEKWLYATYVTGIKKGYIGVNAQTQALEWAIDNSGPPPSTFLIPSPADSATQPLGIMVGSERQTVRVAKNSRGSPDSLALASHPTTEFQKTYIETSTSAFVTVTKDGFILTKNGKPFETFAVGGALVDCEGNMYCGHGGYEEICIETVDVGGIPSKCKAQMDARIPRNPRKIYAATADGGFEGWLQNDGGVFKALARDKSSASPFYAPYVGNGSVSQELFSAYNDGYNSWWGRSVREQSTFSFLGYGPYGVDPGSNGAGSGLPFAMTPSALGALTPSQDFAGGRYSGMSFYFNPMDMSLYLSSSPANAAKIGGIPICLEMVDANDDSKPSVCQSGTVSKRWLWAASPDGEQGGWIGYSQDVGTSGGLQWEIGGSTAERKTFDLTVRQDPNYGKLAVNTAADGQPETVQPVGLLTDSDNANYLSAVSSNDALPFMIPSGGIGEVSHIPAFTWYTRSGAQAIYTCGTSGCGNNPRLYQSICLELVEVGGVPTACAAKLKARIEQNAMLLYARTSTGAGSWVQLGSGNLLVAGGNEDTAGRFYVPDLGNGSVAYDTYALVDDNRYAKMFGIPTEITGEEYGYTKLQMGPAPGVTSGTVPIVYPTGQYGRLSPSTMYYGGFQPLEYYLNNDDNSIHIFPSYALAEAHLGQDISRVCVESVKPGGQPSACLPPPPPRKRGPRRM